MPDEAHAAAPRRAPITTRTFAVTALAVAAIAALPGCGSSEPDYCSDRSNLQESVKGLTGVNLRSGGLSALKSQFHVESDADALVSSAKSDFLSETDAVKSSVSTLGTAVEQLPSSPSAQQIAALLRDVQSVGTAFNSFSDATSSKC
jgi:hypothetical protein